MKSMKLIPMLVTVCLLVVSPAWSQGGNVKQEVRALADQTAEANLKGDASFFEKYYADDAVIVHSDGKTSTKAQEIRALKFGEVKYESYNVHHVQIRVYGNTAVVTSLLTFKGVINGKPYSGDVRTTRVWVKRKGDWKLVAFQSTRFA
jgi:uncharacterized protein (TIGR02246 family)